MLQKAICGSEAGEYIHVHENFQIVQMPSSAATVEAVKGEKRHRNRSRNVLSMLPPVRTGARAWQRHQMSSALLWSAASSGIW